MRRKSRNEKKTLRKTYVKERKKWTKEESERKQNKVKINLRREERKEGNK